MKKFKLLIIIFVLIIVVGGYWLQSGGYGPKTFSPLTDSARSEIEKFFNSF